MEAMELMKMRHSVREYTNKKIEGDTVEALQKLIRECNLEGHLHIQLCMGEPEVFKGFVASYGKFSGVENYIAMIGRKEEDRDERLGYYGEKIVLFATELGLKTCWVAGTYRKAKSKSILEKGEKLVCVIAVGYSDKNGAPHKTKRLEELCRTDGEMPEWFRRGMEAAQLAPTAMNQQKFFFQLSGKAVTATAGGGFYTRLDLGIVKYHFELGAGKDNFFWAE